MEGRPLEETELVERAKRGDQDAYERLVQAHQHIAFRTAFLLAGNAADAEDAEGMFSSENVRLAGNVLLWEEGPLTLRLEADVERAEAVEIARSAAPRRR